ncbi:hypothetical protein Tco_1575925 [Tanacetum coccineum]
MMLESIENGPLVYSTIEENGVIRPKKYAELTEQEQLQDDCDVQAINIILQGLPLDVYSLVNHCKAAKEIWDRVNLLMQGTELSYQEREYSGLAVPSFLPGDDPISCLNKAIAFMSTQNIFQSKKPSYHSRWQGSSSTSSRETGPEFCWVKGIWQISALSLRGQGILHGSRKRCCWFRHKNLTDDLDAYESDCDDISSAKAVLMANLSSYGSNVLFEIDLENKLVNESLIAELERYKEGVKTFEQRLNVDLSSRKKLIDSQMDDMIQNRNALKQEIDLLKQTLSKQIKEKESLLQTFNVFKKESKEKENKSMDKEINLEKKIKELDNIVYKVGQSAQTVHILTEPQVFYDDTHKQALGYQISFYLKKAQRIMPTLYDGIVISKKHDVTSVVDEEETLILEE